MSNTHPETASIGNDDGTPPPPPLPPQPGTFAEALRASAMNMEQGREDDGFHGLVMNQIKGAKPLDYLDALAELVDPKLMTDAGPMGPTKFSVFFSSKEALETVIAAGTINVKDQAVSLNPYLPSLKKLVLTACQPYIKDDQIISALKKLKIKVVGPIEKTRFFSLSEKFAHLSAYRRELHVTLAGSEIPTSIEVLSRGKAHKVGIEHGPRRCFKCNSTRHVAAKCTRQAAPAMATPARGMSTPYTPFTPRVLGSSRKRKDISPPHGGVNEQMFVWEPSIAAHMEIDKMATNFDEFGLGKDVLYQKRMEQLKEYIKFSKTGKRRRKRGRGRSSDS